MKARDLHCQRDVSHVELRKKLKDKHKEATMGKVFNVTIRRDCEICGGDLPKRFRRFCSTKCRDKFYNIKNYARNQEWARRKRGEYAENKLQCLVCGRWYIQVLTHVIQDHHMTSEEYRTEYDLPFKRGVVPQWYHDLKSEITLSNGTIANLEAGAHMRYTKGDPRAKEVTGWKGRNGSKGYQNN